MKAVLIQCGLCRPTMDPSTTMRQLAQLKLFSRCSFTDPLERDQVRCACRRDLIMRGVDGTQGALQASPLKLPKVCRIRRDALAEQNLAFLEDDLVVPTTMQPVGGEMQATDEYLQQGSCSALNKG